MPTKKRKQIEYLLKITDKIGIIEHCLKNKPNYKEGWCVDDNARAIQVGLIYGLDKKIIDIYFNFLKKAWIRGKLFNDLNQDLSWKKNFLINGEHCGRTLFTLGEMIKNNYRKDEAINLFNKIYFLIKKNKTEYLRVIAQTILGLQFYKSKKIKFWADKLIEKYNQESDDDWKWFEKNISYDNGRIPMALLVAYKKTNNKDYLKIGIESLNFLIKETWDKNKKCFSFPGDKGWFTKNGLKINFDQQPIEAGTMVEVCSMAYKITKKIKYKLMAKKAFEWYWGKNILKLKMIDQKTGGVFDGLNEDGKVNQNQGAESILSYLIAAKEIEKFKFD